MRFAPVIHRSARRRGVFVDIALAGVSRAAHARAKRASAGRVRIDAMPHVELEASAQSAPAELSAFVSGIVARCLHIRAVWCVGHADPEAALPDSACELLVFADRPTLQRLRRSDFLHREDVEVFVVFDGNQFENAWGRNKLSGSLARWAWRQVSDELAYYDESRWADHERDGSVVRVRRKATLIWRAQ